MSTRQPIAVAKINTQLLTLSIITTDNRYQILIIDDGHSYNPIIAVVFFLGGGGGGGGGGGRLVSLPSLFCSFNNLAILSTLW